MPTVPFQSNLAATRFTQQTPINPGSTSAVTGGAAFMTLLQAFSGHFASRERAKSVRTIAEANERTAEFRALDARNRGQELVAQVRQKTKKTVGAQRAALAASGIRVGAGSAADIQQETLDVGALDELTIRTNAIREGLGFKTEAIQASAQGAITAGAIEQRGLDTLLTGGLRAASFFGRQRRGV